MEVLAGTAEGPQRLRRKECHLPDLFSAKQLLCSCLSVAADVIAVTHK